jgi:hypothetical protein
MAFLWKDLAYKNRVSIFTSKKFYEIHPRYWFLWDEIIFENVINVSFYEGVLDFLNLAKTALNEH